MERVLCFVIGVLLSFNAWSDPGCARFGSSTYDAKTGFRLFLAHDAEDCEKNYRKSLEREGCNNLKVHCSTAQKGETPEFICRFDETLKGECQIQMECSAGYGFVRPSNESREKSNGSNLSNKETTNTKLKSSSHAHAKDSFISLAEAVGGYCKKSETPFTVEPGPEGWNENPERK